MISPGRIISHRNTPMNKLTLAFSMFVLSTAAPAQQNVKPPIANYWMNVETAAGMSIPGMSGVGGMMAGGMGGSRMQSGKKMHLQLGSQRDANPARADHFIPQGMAMGASLPLTGERSSVPRAGERGDRPEHMERPKGRMLIYWGCGASARPGQPVIIDFARLSAGQAPAMASRRVATGTPPSTSSRGYGEWPNPTDSKPVPASSSLAGSHAIKGNYTPDIQFSLSDDFMDRVELAASQQGAATRVQWNSVPTATGYFATVMNPQGDDVVFWSSSEVQELGSTLMDYIPPVEVARLIRERVVLAPQTTECVVPAEVSKGGGGFLQFIAYGPEANFAHPPRPADTRQPWNPEWAVKVRFKSTAGTMLGADDGGTRANRPGRDTGTTPSEDRAATQPQQPSTPDPVKEGINILKGLFGR